MGDALRNDGYTRRYTRVFFADPTPTSAAYVLLLLFNTQNPISRVAAPTGKYTLTRVREGYITHGRDGLRRGNRVQAWPAKKRRHGAKQMHKRATSAQSSGVQYGGLRDQGEAGGVSG